jgi:hypothetical protein
MRWARVLITFSPTRQTPPCTAVTARRNARSFTDSPGLFVEVYASNFLGSGLTIGAPKRCNCRVASVELTKERGLIVGRYSVRFAKFGVGVVKLRLDYFAFFPENAVCLDENANGVILKLEAILGLSGETSWAWKVSVREQF